MTNTFILICGLVFSGLLLRLAIRFFAKEKYPTCVFLAVVSAVTFCACLPPTQAFLRTWIAHSVNSQIVKLGNQITDVQASVGEMHDRLAEHQRQIGSHQLELEAVQSTIRDTQVEVSDSQVVITNQIQVMMSLQGKLATAEEEIVLQQEQLQDVQFLVDNFFEKMTVEEMSLGDSNTVVTARRDDGVLQVVVVLSSVPIKKSLEFTVTGQTRIPQNLLIVNESFQNLVLCRFHKYDAATTMLRFQYVKDTRKTELIRVSDLKAKGTNIFLSGKRINFITPD